jgi:hypothetical protein
MSHPVAPRGGAKPRVRLALLAAGLVLALTLAALASRLGGRPAALPASAPADGAPAALAGRLAALEDGLAFERAARESLAAEVAELNARIQAALPEPGATERAGGAPAHAAAADEREEEARDDEPAAARTTAAPLFDVATLVAGGCMNRGEAEALRARWERFELERLEVNDRAMRGGYFMRPRHGQEQRALEAAFREELGDGGYDAYLRATGKPNRFTLREVLVGGAGNAAGLQTGDELVRYDGVRVFSTGDLQVLTSAGRPGELVPLEVIRGGQPLTLRAARGPLGVVLDGVVRPPEDGCAR